MGIPLEVAGGVGKVGLLASLFIVGFGALPFRSCLIEVGERGSSFSPRSACLAFAILAAFVSPLAVGDSLSKTIERVGEGVRSSATGDKSGAVTGVGS